MLSFVPELGLIAASKINLRDPSMPGQMEKRLSELGIKLPEAALPAANYVPYVITGNQIFVSGQLPL